MRISRHLFRQILVFAGVLLALVLFLAWWGLRRALDEQAWARADEAAERLSMELDRDTQRVSRLGSTLRDWWLAGAYDLADPERLDTLALPLLEHQTFVSSVNFCAADGTSVLLLRTGGAWHTRQIVRGPDGGRLRWVRRGGGAGAPPRVEPWTPTTYDPRTRDWYLLVSESATPRWSPEAYRLMTTRDPGLTLSFPVRSGGRLLGVVAVDVLLDDLTGKAWEVQPTPGARVAIADRSGRALILPRRPRYEAREARFEDFLRPIGPAFLPELAELVSGLDRLPDAGRRARTRADHEDHYAVVKPFRGPSDLTWYLLVAIPEEEIVGRSRAKGLGVLAFALLGFATLSWRAWSIAQRFGRPLDRLARSAERRRPGAGDPGDGDGEVWEPVALQDGLRLADRAVEERIALREQLRSSQRRETIGTLAGGVVHDVNNQLTVALGQLEPCIEELGPGHPIVPELALARDALLRCAETTKALLAYSRSAAPSAAAPVDLNRLLRSVAALIGRVLGGRVTLSLELAPGLPAVEGVRVQLEQVVVNLAINARDAMPDGGTLTLRTGAGEDGTVRLSVSDTGIGMSPEVKARIFEPYFTTKGEGRGTGLGLSMVYGIVRSHGGRVEVESAEGAGTTFTVSLPATTAAVVPEAPATAAPPPDRLRGKRLLVVDDEPALRKVLEDQLARAGAFVTAAGDGVEAAEAWRAEGPFDGVVSDLRMPRASGLDLYRAVRAASPEVPFLLMSGDRLEDESRSLAGDRRAGTLAKPWEAAALLAALERLVDPPAVADA